MKYITVEGQRFVILGSRYRPKMGILAVVRVLDGLRVAKKQGQSWVWWEGEQTAQASGGALEELNGTTTV